MSPLGGWAHDVIVCDRPAGKAGQCPLGVSVREVKRRIGQQGFSLA